MSGLVRILRGAVAWPSRPARAQARLEHLHELSTTLLGGARCSTVHVNAAIDIVRRTIPLHSALCTLGVAGGAPTVEWHSAAISAAQVKRAQLHARARHGELSRNGYGAPWGGTGFVNLPLAVAPAGTAARVAIVGSLQLEPIARFTTEDREFAGRIAQQLALALHRHELVQQRMASAEGDRDRAELRYEMVRELHERNRALVDNLDHAFVWEADTSTLRLNYVSKRAETLMGFPRALALDDDRLLLRYVHPDDVEQVRDQLAAILGEEEDRSFLHRCLAADGSARWLRTGVHLVKAGGASARFQGVSVDVTAQRAVEEENQRLYQQAQQAARSRQDLLAIVSHDLRNPLGVMLMNIALLEKDARENDRRRSRQPLEMMSRAGTQMRRLIEDLLDGASIEAQHLSIDQRPVPCGQLVESALETFAPQAAERGIRLASEVAPGLPAAIADAARVQQVLTNLVGNALKLTPREGTITLRARAGDRQDVVLSVSDTAMGIAEDDLPRLFDQFWQGEGKARCLGSGLGLYIVKGIVEAHGGRVWVESALGRGSTFFFTLPTRS